MGKDEYGALSFPTGTDINAINKTGSVPRYINDPEYDTRTHTFSLISVKDIYWDGSLTDREPTMFLSGNRSSLNHFVGRMPVIAPHRHLEFY